VSEGRKPRNFIERHGKHDGFRGGGKLGAATEREPIQRDLALWRLKQTSHKKNTTKKKKAKQKKKDTNTTTRKKNKKKKKKKPKKRNKKKTQHTHDKIVEGRLGGEGREPRRQRHEKGNREKGGVDPIHGQQNRLGGVCLGLWVGGGVGWGGGGGGVWGVCGAGGVWEVAWSPGYPKKCPVNPFSGHPSLGRKGCARRRLCSVQTGVFTKKSCNH